MSFQRTPALSWLSAGGAFAAMAILHVAVPALHDPSRRDFVLRVVRLGDFATNLAVIAGMVALADSLPALVRPNHVVDLHRRLVLASSGAILATTVVVATVLERSRTTGQLVLFAIAAAHMLSSLVNASVARVAQRGLGRALAWCAASMAVASLVGEALRLVTLSRMDTWIVRSAALARALAEIGYLGLLVLLAAWMLPTDASRRSMRARRVAFFFLPLVLGGLYLAEKRLGGDFTAVLFHSQRVHLFLDSWPRVYGVPLALALSCALAGVLCGQAHRHQAAAATLLILSSGHAPHVLGRLLTLTVGLVLVARSVLAHDERVANPSGVVEGADRARDGLAGTVDDVRSDGVAQP